MREIPLTQGKVALVDDEWYPILSRVKWYYNPSRDIGGYAHRDSGTRGCRLRLAMHRYIMMAPDGLEVDHINGNKLDNRTENLRVVLPIVNHQNKRKPRNNTSGYKGVCFDKSRGKFTANIGMKGKTFHLGRFVSIVDAARAYNEAALRLYGEGASLNEVE